MKTRIVLPLLLAAIYVAGASIARSEDGWRGISLSDSKKVAQEPRRVVSLDRMLAEIVDQAIEEEGHGAVSPGEVFATVIDLRDSHDPKIGSLRGDRQVYPASVIKLCYMLAAYDQERTGLIEFDEEFRKTMRLMIEVSDNVATNAVLDRVTNTGYGEELDDEAWESFIHKRQKVDRYLKELGLDGLSATNKTFGNRTPFYGRDPQWLGTSTHDHYERSNMMTTDDTARLLYLIWRHAVVDAEACDEMLELLRREEGRQRTFSSSIVPEDAKGHYAKDGLTWLERHDAAIYDFGEEGAVIVVVFSLNRNIQSGKTPRVIQRTAQLALEKVRATPGVHGQADPEADKVEDRVD